MKWKVSTDIYERESLKHNLCLLIAQLGSLSLLLITFIVLKIKWYCLQTLNIIANLCKRQYCSSILFFERNILRFLGRYLKIPFLLLEPKRLLCERLFWVFIIEFINKYLKQSRGSLYYVPAIFCSLDNSKAFDTDQLNQLWIILNEIAVPKLLT